MLVVTGVGFLIHLYSTSYMADDKGYARFFAYLNLFIFSMLVLILGDNLPVLFVGWEGVGLCSYLLIGFWYENAAERGRGQEGVHRQPHRRLRPHLRDVPARALHGRPRLERDRQRRLRSASPGRTVEGARMAARRRAVHGNASVSYSPRGPSPSARRRPWASRSSWVARARARRFRSTFGSPTRWRVRRRSPRSSTRPRWSPPAST